MAAAQQSAWTVSCSPDSGLKRKSNDSVGPTDSTRGPHRNFGKSVLSFYEEKSSEACRSPKQRVAFSPKITGCFLLIKTSLVLEGPAGFFDMCTTPDYGRLRVAIIELNSTNDTSLLRCAAKRTSAASCRRLPYSLLQAANAVFLPAAIAIGMLQPLLHLSMSSSPSIDVVLDRCAPSSPISTSYFLTPLPQLRPNLLHRDHCDGKRCAQRR